MKGEIGLHLFIYLVSNQHTYGFISTHVQDKFANFYVNIYFCTGEANTKFVNSVEMIIKCFQNCYGIELQMCDDFHISLTRTFILRHHWIEGFVTSVKKQLNGISRLVIFFTVNFYPRTFLPSCPSVLILSIYRPFQLLGTNALSVYTNEERNRTFLGIVLVSNFNTNI